MSDWTIESLFSKTFMDKDTRIKLFNLLPIRRIPVIIKVNNSDSKRRANMN